MRKKKKAEEKKGMSFQKSLRQQIFLQMGQNEKLDLFTLGMGLIVILITWIIFFGWSTDLAMSSQDGSTWIPFFRDFLKAGGGWKDRLYIFELSGGGISHDVVGTLPLAEICGMLGLSAVATLNCINIFIQLVYGFLGSRIAVDLSFLWHKSEKSPYLPPSWLFRFGMFWIIAFAPFMSWRIIYGHWMLLLGLFVFLAGLSMILAIQRKNFTLTLGVVCAFALMNTFPTSGQQTIFYSVLFGGPILLGVIWPRNGWTREALLSVIFSIGIFLGVLGLSMPKFAGMLAYATGSDTSRPISGDGITYAYTIGNLREWIASIPWSLEWIPSYREFGFWHEVNYPFGPLLLLLFLIPWKKNKALRRGLIISVISAIILSDRIKPLSTFMIQLIPPLKLFRVPERAMLPFCMILPIIAVAAILFRQRKTKNIIFETVIVLLSLGLFALPVVAREVIEWIVVLFIVLFYKNSYKLADRFAALSYSSTAICIILGIGSIAAYKERVLPFYSSYDLLEVPNSMRDTLYHLDPRLSHPLNRASLNFNLGPFHVNSAQAASVSSLDGYWNPSLRLLNLLTAVEKQYYHPTTMVIRVGSNSTAFPILRVLYNIVDLITLEAGRPKLISSGETLGPAWFSNSLVPLESFDELALTLQGHSDHLRSALLQSAWYIRTDQALRNLQFPQISKCEGSQVFSTEAEHAKHFVHVKVQSTSYCPLTLSMNYGQQLQAYLLHQGTKDQHIPVFPTYGSLTGILVPPGQHEIWVEAEPYLPLWSKIAWLGGALVLISSLFLIFVFQWRQQMNVQEGISAT